MTVHASPQRLGDIKNALTFSPCQLPCLFQALREKDKSESLFHIAGLTEPVKSLVMPVQRSKGPKVFLMPSQIADLRLIMACNCGNSDDAKRTGAVASPSWRSAAAGLPSMSADETKSSRSSTSCKAMLVRTTLCLWLSNLEGDAQVLPVQEGIVSLDGACLILKMLDRE